jgi:hypothetical protein
MTVDFFKLRIAEKDLVSLPRVGESKEDDVVEEVRIRKMKIGNLGPLTMFGERGRYGGHLYQPKVNHRDVTYASLNEKTKYVYDYFGEREQLVDGLMESMASPKKESHFSLGNEMAFMAYELTEKKYGRGSEVAEVKSVASFGVDGCSGHAALMNYYARKLSVEGFERTLNVFGFRRNEAFGKESEVAAEEVVSFLYEVCSIKMGSKNRLRKYVEKFGLQEYFEVTHGSIEKQHEMFSKVVRSLVPFRLAAYDGLHRFCASCYFMTGVFDPNNELVLKASTFNVVYHKEKLKELTSLGGLGTTFKNGEVFSSQHIMYVLE